MSENTPAYTAVRCRINLSLGPVPDNSSNRRPGKNRRRWIDNNTPPADLWMTAIHRGHHRETLRPPGYAPHVPRWLCIDDDDDESGNDDNPIDNKQLNIFFVFNRNSLTVHIVSQ